MLRRPHKLPQRFNRPITAQTRRIVEKRHHRHAGDRWQQWQRFFQRLSRRVQAAKAWLLQFLLLFTVGGVILMLILLTFSPLLHLRAIRVVRSNPRIDVEQIQRSLTDLFGEHLFFLSVQDVRSRLEEAVLDMADATIEKQYPSTLELRLTLQPIVARLTIEEPLKERTGTGAMAMTGAMAGRKDYLTEDGLYVPYAEAQVQSGTGMLNLRIVDWGVRPVPWEMLIEPSLLEAMREAETALRDQFGQAVTHRTVYVRAREYHFGVDGKELWFDVRSSLQDQFNRYRLFLQTTGLQAVQEYVDLRLQEKVVYK